MGRAPSFQSWSKLMLPSMSNTSTSPCRRPSSGTAFLAIASTWPREGLPVRGCAYSKARTWPGVRRLRPVGIE